MLFKYLFNINLVVVGTSDFILINKEAFINPTGRIYFSNMFSTFLQVSEPDNF